MKKKTEDWEALMKKAKDSIKLPEINLSGKAKEIDRHEVNKFLYRHLFGWTIDNN